MSQAQRKDVLNQVRQGIEDGHWGELLPPITKLRAEFGCSREVIEAVLRDLCNEGLVVKRGRRHYLDDVAHVDRAAVTRRRVALITDLYTTGLTLEAFLQLSPTDQQALTGRSGSEGYRRLQLAVDTFRSPTADTVRASLGHHEATRHLATLTARRDAYAAETHQPFYRVKRWERRGAEEFAGHLEALTILFDQDLLTTDEPAHADPVNIPALMAAITDLEHRIRTLEIN